MLKILKWILGLFSPYVNSFERKVDKFFKNVRSTSSSFSVQRGLLLLMQKNLIVTNVWMEKKFKGYVYLDKKTRKQMYSDVLHIIEEFKKFCDKNVYAAEDVKAAVKAKGLSFPNGSEKEFCYMYQIMSFLRPGLYYNYIETASFGKLLRDPRHEKLEGDCNQIVTLYIYLYSLRFQIKDLNIKLLPEHVCLHFRGIDVEATNGTFQDYDKDDEILPVTEIISTNLLDLLDFRESVQSISPRVMVKSAQLAYSISSLKPLVLKNLNIAYNNLAISAMKSGNFQTARFYAEQSKDSDLLRSVKNNEAVSHFKAKRFDKAIKLFSELGATDSVKACYSNQYNDLSHRLKGVKTLRDAKKYKSVYKKMLSLARKMGDEHLIHSLRDTLGKL